MRNKNGIPILDGENVPAILDYGTAGHCSECPEPLTFTDMMHTDLSYPLCDRCESAAEHDAEVVDRDLIQEYYSNL
jgi:hypothetical protein